MEPKDRDLSITKIALNTKTNDTQGQSTENVENQLLNPEELRAKTSILLSSPNNPEKEKDFRGTCLLYQKNSTSSPVLNEAYQEYIKAYKKVASLYFLDLVDKRSNLIIYDTESEREEAIPLETLEMLDNSTCIVQLPNGDLFCFSSTYTYPVSGITLIIDRNYRIRQLPYGTPCEYSSAIYFNKSVYCLGGWDNCTCFSPSSRFDLDENRWITLAPMWISDDICNSVVFKGNILISGFYSRNIWVYSIDIDSFSEINYDFGDMMIKILINVEERLYLIECMNGGIYESEVEDEYTWKMIERSTISLITSRVYSIYNKGEIYIGWIQYNSRPNTESHYYKFNLAKKIITKLK